MKLFWSGTSPFVRKVVACAIAIELDERIEKISTNPWESPAELVAQNPLSKVPCLLTDDGLALFDSPVICDYLDFLVPGVLLPPPGAARFRALKQQAVADGLLDAAVLRRMEGTRAEDAARSAVMERQRAIVARALALLEEHPPSDHVDVGTIAVACALGYLDFRFAHEPWRDGCPNLAAWHERMAQRPEMERTKPA